jgi:hypothetical protein
MTSVEIRKSNKSMNAIHNNTCDNTLSHLTMTRSRPLHEFDFDISTDLKHAY